MNNNLYHWHDEQMVRHEMDEVNDAVEQVRLLREAGLSGPSLLTWVTKALDNLLKGQNERHKESSSPKHQSY